MYVKLSARNLKRCASDYAIYLFTLVLSFTLIYAYNCLIFSKPIQELCTLLDSLTGMLIFVTVTMLLILGWLISYIVRFIFGQRSREFACYMTMGMERKYISRMFLCEQMVLGFFSFLVGSVIGNFLYYGIIQVVYYFFGASYGFDLTYLLPSLGATFLCYLFLFFVVLLFQNWRLSQITVTDLLDHNKKNQDMKKITGKTHLRNIILFLLTTGISVYCLYQLFFQKAPDAIAPVYLFLGGSLLLVSILFFYRESAYVIYTYYKRHPGRNLHKEKLFFFRQLTSRLSTNSWRLGVLSILGFFAIMGLCGSFIPAGGIDEEIAQNVPFDLGIMQLVTDDEQQAMKEDPEILQTGSGIDTAAYEKVITSFTTIVDKHKFQLYDLEGSRFLSGLGLMSGYSVDDRAVSLSDYNAMRHVLGYSSIELAKGSYVIHCASPSASRQAMDATPVFSLDGQNYQLQECPSEYMSVSGLISYGSILVLPDGSLDSMIPSVFSAVYKTGIPLPLSSADDIDAVKIRLKEENPDIGYVYIYHKNEYIQETKSTYLFIILLCAYTAFICLFIIGTILSVQQLSESRRSRRQFGVMLDLGASRRDLEKGITRHLAVYFLFPLILPVIYSGIYLGMIISQGAFSTGIVLWGTLLSVLTLTVIYGVYFLVTNYQYQKHVLKDRRLDAEDLISPR